MPSKSLKKPFFHHLANPTRFLIMAQKYQLCILIVSLLFIGIGMVWGLFFAPPDYQQKETVRIMYVHVPSSWMALMIYMVMASMAVCSLVWRHLMADLITQASAPIGGCFTLISLMTGAIWGKPMWGTWWVWDARLTSVLILFFLYIGYMALIASYEEWGRSARSGAILLIIGMINIPIIKGSVEWWNTLHQPASFTRFSAPSIHISMAIPLLIVAGGFALFYLAVLFWRVKAIFLERKLQKLLLTQELTNITD